MALESSVTIAAALISDDSKNAALALCAIHTMRDKRFRDLVAALVELNPRKWPEALRFVRGFTEKSRSA